MKRLIRKIGRVRRPKANKRNAFISLIIVGFLLLAYLRMGGYIDFALETEGLGFYDDTVEYVYVADLTPEEVAALQYILTDEGGGSTPTHFEQTMYTTGASGTANYVGRSSSLWSPIESSSWDTSATYKGYCFGESIDDIIEGIQYDDFTVGYYSNQKKLYPGTIPDFTDDYDVPSGGTDTLYEFLFVYRSGYELEQCNENCYDAYYSTDEEISDPPYHPDMSYYNTWDEFNMRDKCDCTDETLYCDGCAEGASNTCDNNGLKYYVYGGNQLLSGNSIFMWKEVPGGVVSNPYYQRQTGGEGAGIYTVYDSGTSEPQCVQGATVFYDDYKWECYDASTGQLKKTLVEMKHQEPSSYDFGVGFDVQARVTGYADEATDVTVTLKQFGNVIDIGYGIGSEEIELSGTVIGTASLVIEAAVAGGDIVFEDTISVDFAGPELSYRLIPPGTTKNYKEDFTVEATVTGLIGITGEVTLSQGSNTQSFGPTYSSGDTVQISISDPEFIGIVNLDVHIWNEVYDEHKTGTMSFNQPGISHNAPGTCKAKVPFDVTITSSVPGNLIATIDLVDSQGTHSMPTGQSYGGDSVTIEVDPSYACEGQATLIFVVSLDGASIDISNHALSISKPSFSTSTGSGPFLYNEEIHIDVNIEEDFYNANYMVTTVAKKSGQTVGSSTGTVESGIDITISQTGDISFISTASIEGCPVEDTIIRTLGEPSITIDCAQTQYKMEAFQVTVSIGADGNYNNHPVNLVLETLNGQFLANALNVNAHPSVITFPGVDHTGNARLTAESTLGTGVTISSSPKPLYFTEEDFTFWFKDSQGNFLSANNLQRGMTFYIHCDLGNKPNAKFKAEIFNSENLQGGIIKTIPVSGSQDSPIMVEYPDFAGEKSIKVTAYDNGEEYTSDYQNVNFVTTSPMGVDCWSCSFSSLVYKQDFSIQVGLDGGPTATPTIDVYLYDSNDILKGSWLDKSPGLIQIIEPAVSGEGYLKLELSYIGLDIIYTKFVEDLYFANPSLTVNWPIDLEVGKDFQVSANAQGATGLPMTVTLLQGGMPKQTWTNGVTPTMVCTKPKVAGWATMKVEVKWDSYVTLTDTEEIYLSGDPIICTPFTENQIQYSGPPVIFGVYLEDINGNPLSPAMLDSYNFRAWFSEGTGTVTNIYYEFLGITNEGAEYKVTLGVNGIGILHSEMDFTYNGEFFTFPATQGQGIKIESNAVAIDTSGVPTSVTFGETKTIRIKFQNSIGEIIEPDNFQVEVDLPTRIKYQEFNKWDFTEKGDGVYEMEYTFEEIEMYTFRIYAQKTTLQEGQRSVTILATGEGGMVGPDWISFFVNYWYIMIVIVAIVVFVIWRRI